MREPGSIDATLLRAVAAAIAMTIASTALVATPGWPTSSQTEPSATTTEPERTDPLADLETIAPVDVPGPDFVLDVVGVRPNATVRKAEDALDRAASAQGVASLQLMAAEQERARRAQIRVGADQLVGDAERAHREAKQALAEAEVELENRTRVERRRRAALAVEQNRLRAMAAQLLTAVPDDRYLVLSDLDDITEASRRTAARDRGVELQSNAVDAAKGPWLQARQARQRQRARVDDGEAAVDRAASDLRSATNDRDHAAAELVKASSVADTRRDEFDAAADRAADALADRRRARLDAEAADLPMRLVSLHAYWRAAQLAPCHIPWWLLAGVGLVETRHGTAFGSKVDAEGNTTVHIIGIPLDGRPGIAAVHDTDGGRLDGDGVWDRAVGPMQFLPGTWRVLGRDGNGDGEVDPHNLYDAARGASVLLCFGGDLTTGAGQRAGLLRYNPSNAYVDRVLAETGPLRDALDLPDIPPRPGDT